MQDTIEAILERCAANHAAYTDLRVENSDYASITVTNGEVEQTTVGRESGLGVRVLKEGAWGFAYGPLAQWESTVDMAMKSITLAVRFKKEDVTLAEAHSIQDKVEVSFKKDPDDVTIEEKAKMVLAADKTMAIGDPVKSTTVGYRDAIRRIFFANSEGTRLEIKTPYVMMYAQCTVKEADGSTLEARSRLGHVGGMEIFDAESPESVGKRAMEDAVAGIKSPKPPAGKHDVVMDGSMNGLFAHEAVGHSSEGDFCRTAGVLRGKLGKRVGAKNVTLIDDGSLREVDGRNLFGFIPYDDEGVKPRRVNIIDDGILKHYLLDRATAHYFDQQPTGNARAMFFSNPQIVRMRNTWIEATNDPMNQEELVEEIGTGLLLKKGGGGQVDPIRGTFNFGTNEIWTIKKGEIGERLRPTTCAGNTLQTLKNIVGVSNQFDNVTHSIGCCGKGGQNVPTSIGGGWMAVKDIVVGG